MRENHRNCTRFRRKALEMRYVNMAGRLLSNQNIHFIVTGFLASIIYHFSTKDQRATYDAVDIFFQDRVFPKSYSKNVLVHSGLFS